MNTIMWKIGRIANCTILEPLAVWGVSMCYDMVQFVSSTRNVLLIDTNSRRTEVRLVCVEYWLKRYFFTKLFGMILTSDVDVLCTMYSVDCIVDFKDSILQEANVNRNSYKNKNYLGSIVKSRQNEICDFLREWEVRGGWGYYTMHIPLWNKSFLPLLSPTGRTELTGIVPVPGCGQFGVTLDGRLDFFVCQSRVKTTAYHA